MQHIFITNPYHKCLISQIQNHTKIVTNSKSQISISQSLPKSTKASQICLTNFYITNASYHKFVSNSHHNFKITISKSQFLTNHFHHKFSLTSITQIYHHKFNTNSKYHYFCEIQVTNSFHTIFPISTFQ